MEELKHVARMIGCKWHGAKKEGVEAIVQQTSTLFDEVENAKSQLASADVEEREGILQHVAQHVFGIEQVREEQIHVMQRVLSRSDTVRIRLSPSPALHRSHRQREVADVPAPHAAPRRAHARDLTAHRAHAGPAQAASAIASVPRPLGTHDAADARPGGLVAPVGRTKGPLHVSGEGVLLALPNAAPVDLARQARSTARGRRGALHLLLVVQLPS